MEEGTKTKKTIFVGGIGDDIDQTIIYEQFSTFGDIIEVQLPLAPANPGQQGDVKHRGFAFVTYGSSNDAQDAIDNMDMNELKGKVIKVNLARPMKGPIEAGNNRAVWESEEWLKQHAKPLAESGGVQGRTANRNSRPKDEPKTQDVDEDMEE